MTARELVGSIVDRGDRGAGAQFVVTIRGDRFVDDGFGIARPGHRMTPDTVQSLFCLTKPIVGASVLAVAERRGISLDEDVARSSPRLKRMLGGRSLCLRGVLSHTAELHRVLAAEVMFMPRADRLAATKQIAFATNSNSEAHHAYSEFQGWNVLRVWLEDVTGLPFGAAMRSASLEPLGLRDLYFGVDDTEWEDVRERLGVHYQMDQGVARPLLHELLRKHLDDPAMQSVGGYGSARAVARFYCAALRARAGETVEGVPSPSLVRAMVTPRAAAQVDPVLTLRVSFGLGFMTDLQGAFGPSIGSAAFGHIGLLGNAFAFADPELDLVVVFVSNGFMIDDEQRLVARASIVRAIYDEVSVTT
jgi:CubicO group peptidase (beta-lactamase class C family)